MRHRWLIAASLFVTAEAGATVIAGRRRGCGLRATASDATLAPDQCPVPFGSRQARSNGKRQAFGAISE
jgi:hypothetical protein